jgi:hypothetical protein
MPILIPPEIQTAITQAVDWLWEEYGKASFKRSSDFQIAVYHLINKHFDLSELQDLCFNLSIDFDNLNGENKRDKAREAVAYCQRYDLIPELKTKLAEL